MVAKLTSSCKASFQAQSKSGVCPYTTTHPLTFLSCSQPPCSLIWALNLRKLNLRRACHCRSTIWCELNCAHSRSLPWLELRDTRHYEPHTAGRHLLHGQRVDERHLWGSGLHVPALWKRNDCWLVEIKFYLQHERGHSSRKKVYKAKCN